MTAVRRTSLSVSVGAGRTTPASANGLPPSPNADCKIDGRSDSSALPRNVAEANYRYARDGEPYAEFGSEYAVVTAKWEDDKFDVESITGYYHFDQYDLNNVSGEAYPASFTQFADFTQYSQELLRSRRSSMGRSTSRPAPSGRVASSSSTPTPISFRCRSIRSRVPTSPSAAITDSSPIPCRSSLRRHGRSAISGN